MNFSGRKSSKSTKKEPDYALTKDAQGMELCPICRKATAPLFIWRFDDASGICLECFHKLPEKEQKYHEVRLAGESKAGAFVWKVVGLLLLVAVVLGGGICVFYKPHTQPVAKAGDAAEKADGQKVAKRGHGADGEGGGPAEGDTDKSGDTEKDKDKDDSTDSSPDEKSTDGKSDDKKAGTGDTIGVAGAKGDDKQQHMAPTVQAVAANLPRKSRSAKEEVQAPSGIAKIINEAQAAADALHPQGAPGAAPAESKPAINPTSKTKEEAAKTKEAALAVASAIIEKHDQDGTKTAELLGKIGQVSTTFADVATKMTEGIPTTGKGGGGGGGSAGGSTRLEGDVLASQGRSGYDPEEAVKRELAEEAGAAQQKTIQMAGDPKAGQKPPGVQSPSGGPAALAAGAGTPAPGVSPFRVVSQTLATTKGAASAANPAMAPDSGSNSGIVQDSTALAMASLPAAFASAAGGNGALIAGGGSAGDGSEAGGAGGADPAHTGRLSVVVLSMRGDLLFDFNSAALRPEASVQLGELAQVLARRPNLPLLIRGYTDVKGTVEANLALSRKRAEAVRDWLVARIGIKAQAVTVQGLGASDPVAPNQNADGSDSPAGREKNRRVTVTIPQQQAPQTVAS